MIANELAMWVLKEIWKNCLYVFSQHEGRGNLVQFALKGVYAQLVLKYSMSYFFL